MKSNYDVVVVGSGTGGAVLSRFLVERGLSVGLFEKSARDTIHKICGDATSEVHFNRAAERDPDKQNKIELPSHHGEVHETMRGFSFITPTGKRYDIPAEGEGWIIDRAAFTARLIREAEDAGVDYFDQTTVRQPIVENHSLVGVNLRTAGKELRDVRAKVVVDASGMAGIIRRQLNPHETKMDRVIRHYDMASAHRELVNYNGFEFEKPDHIEIYFDLENCPGGYFWVFPRGSTSANVGLGIEPRRYPGGPRKAYDWWVGHLPHFKDYEVVHAGGATVPLRRPIDTLVWNGLVLIGDAGACVKATDGGGIGLSLISASQAASPIAAAIEADDLSRDGPLWDYNVAFHRQTSKHEAPLAYAKTEIVKVNNKILNVVFEDIISPKDLYNLNAGRPIDTSTLTTLKRVWRGKSILPFLIRLTKVMKTMDKVKSLYANFPDNYHDFLQWKATLEYVFQDKKRAATFYAETGSQPRDV